MSSPRNKTRPLRAGVMPEIDRSVVDFPAPLEPIIVTISPASTRSDTPLSAAIEPSLVPVGQVRRHLVDLAQPHEVQQLAGPLARLALLATHVRRAEDRARDARLQTAVHADLDVLDRRHAVEQADVLERAGDPRL